MAAKLTSVEIEQQKQLVDMEGEVEVIQKELAAIRLNRHINRDVKKDTQGMESEEVVTDSKLYEPYKFQDVKSSKEDNEILKLREELIRAKNSAEVEKFERLKYEGKLKDLEVKLNDICACAPGKASDSKESRKITEDEVVGLKTQVRDLKEQIEEMKLTDDEKSDQIQDYRVKYIQAQQQVEELKRQIDVMEFDNKQASDQIQIELQRMKMQFQDKLLELAPLPDLLKGAQIQLQEAKQLQKLAEDNSQEMANELLRSKEKLVITLNNLNQEKIERSKILEDNNAYKVELDEKQKEVEGFMKEIDEYRCKVFRLEEKLSQQAARYSEKAEEYVQLVKVMEEMKIENTKSKNRAKDRSEATRHYLQTQITGLEAQIISCRAQCRCFQKERDDARQKVQIQIHCMKESFEVMERRLQGLQKQVSILKHCCAVNLPDNVEEVRPRHFLDDPDDPIAAIVLAVLASSDPSSSGNDSQAHNSRHRHRPRRREVKSKKFIGLCNKR